jgi:hypothetical protein
MLRVACYGNRLIHHKGTKYTKNGKLSSSLGDHNVLVVVNYRTKITPRANIVS